MIKKRLIPYYISFLETRANCKLLKNKSLQRPALEASIIKQLHGVEKGLCLGNPRLSFGVSKIHALFDYTQRYLEMADGNYFCLYMVRDVIQAYLDFHKEKAFTSAEIEGIAERLELLKAQLPVDDALYGGVLTLKQDQILFTTEQVENLFRTRHSIRDFSGETVNQEDIKKAIALAQLCPSACNRQCARVYYVEKQKFMKEMNSDLQGIGGFADDACGFLLVTGRKSAYGQGERNQYIVSAAIFAGYLSLALHAYNIAACTVQRSVSPNGMWDHFKELNHIAEDEQIVVMFAVGKYKEETKVPVSKRFPVDIIYKELK